MRKIIQIQEVPENQYHPGYLVALCDDGTVWFFANHKWEKIEAIPQDD